MTPTKMDSNGPPIGFALVTHNRSPGNPPADQAARGTLRQRSCRLFTTIPQSVLWGAATGFDNPGWGPAAGDRYIAVKLWVRGFSWPRRHPSSRAGRAQRLDEAANRWKVLVESETQVANGNFMAPSIGFVLVTYNQPGQMLRLTRRLAELYDNPPIACHHDFGQSSLCESDFPSSVSFLHPHIQTRWGHISCINAFRAALRMLYARPDSPDWFVFVSGSDYPVRSRDLVLHDLTSGGFDALLDHRRIRHSSGSERTDDATGFNHPDWMATAYRRYVGVDLWIPGYSWKRRKLTKLRFHTVRTPFLVRALDPGSTSFGCYGGDWWFTGNRRAARCLLDDSPLNSAILKHFAERFIPEEAALHTLLCNHPELRISTANKRYSDWSSGGHHPKMLGIDDIPRIVQSGAHFARKFSPGSEALDRIDEIVDRQNAS